MRSLFQSTLLQLALFAGVGLVVGYELSSIWAGLALAAVIYIAIMLLNFRRVSDWLLLGARGEIPVANTFWTTIMDQISRIIRKLEVENSAL
ncbi:phosphate regulon sensor protein PhoR, partial [Pseudomonadales bacterium]|nr:phosphate regulon sensor protein PhoR [Pseudomonadales bacterium]